MCTTAMTILCSNVSKPRLHQLLLNECYGLFSSTEEGVLPSARQQGFEQISRCVRI